MALVHSVLRCIAATPTFRPTLDCVYRVATAERAKNVPLFFPKEKKIENPFSSDSPHPTFLTPASTVADMHACTPGTLHGTHNRALAKKKKAKMVALLLPFLFCSTESDSLGGAPVLPREGSSWTDSGRSMDTFYSADGATQWQPVLGDAMHYHHGVFEESELNAKHISDQQACDPPTPAATIFSRPAPCNLPLLPLIPLPRRAARAARCAQRVSFPERKMREIIVIVRKRRIDRRSSSL